MRNAWGVRDDAAPQDASAYDPRTGVLLPSAHGGAVPRRAVGLAVLLLAAGFSCLVAGLALGAQGTPNATPLTVLGALMFLPGAYYSRLAYHAWRGADGFSFAALPEVL